MNPKELQIILGLLNVALPGGIALVHDIAALFKKYPGLTVEQFTAIVKEIASNADIIYDATKAQILADQAAHPATPTP